MTAQGRSPPSNAVAIAADALARVASARAAIAPERLPGAALVGPRRSAPSEALGEAYPVYVVAASDVARRRSLALAKRAAWRYTVIRGDKPSGVLELRPVGRTFKFSKLHEGERGEASERAVAVVRDRPRGLSVRFLRIPSLNLLAAWGHDARRPGSDVLVPVPPVSRPFQPFAAMTAAELVEAVRGLAPRPQPRGTRSTDATLPTEKRSPPPARGRGSTSRR